jgi:hypothetical protein
MGRSSQLSPRPDDWSVALNQSSVSVPLGPPGDMRTLNYIHRPINNIIIFVQQFIFTVKNPIKAKPLSEAQLMVLQVVKNQYDDEDLNELRELLLDFVDKRVQQHLDKTVAEKGYTDKDFEDMLYRHSKKVN